MDIGLKNTIIDDKLFTVIDTNTYYKNVELYHSTDVAIEMEKNGIKYVLPIRSLNDNRPGVYGNMGKYLFEYKLPETEEDINKYDSSKMEIIDHSNIANMSEYISKRKQLRDMEAGMLTEIDKVFAPPIEDGDKAEMIALKTAIGLKNCDINKYESRFGPNFLNTKSLFKKNSISMNKLIYVADSLDMEVEIKIRDKNNNVPNPMNDEVVMILTGGIDNE